ncbi:hypothetical protein RHMOL_Rhmol03G0134300 [Rhododendron molle]|uniref:Uncharacterized protein n=4 Tax=Rhododendron molle TaxID=49168 RepID=A0ACC0PFG7_RHOML|nr:hypothetical protein RHMOL_Rhmol03G0134300 [Rhododendron molle]
MAVSSSLISMSLVSTTLMSNKSNLPSSSSSSLNSTSFSPHNTIICSTDPTSNEDRNCERRPLLLGVGALALSLFPASSIFAQEIPEKYDSFVDKLDGYSYYYPSDWREFDFRGHDSAFKDRYLQLQNVRVSFIPTDKTDIHDLGPMEEVVSYLLKHVYAAPTQMATVFDMQERTVDGKNYYTFEYALTNRNFSRAAFATLGIGNGRYYTLIVGANERRWRRVRNQLKVVADSFKMLDI